MKVTLVVILLVAAITAHEGHFYGSKIDAIIEKHYKKYLESLPSEQRNEVVFRSGFIDSVRQKVNRHQIGNTNACKTLWLKNTSIRKPIN